MLKFQQGGSAMQEILPILLRCPLFDGIAAQDLSAMLGCLSARKMPMKKGQTLLREGDSTQLIGIVLEGAVQILREDYFGNRSIMGHIGQTQLFGESYAFAGTKTLPVSVVADSDGSVLMIDSRRISSCCANVCEFHNRMIENMLRLVATHNLMLHQKIYITSKRSTREKLMTYLMHEAKRQGSRDFAIPFDRQALADYLGVERSAMSAEISKLQRDGVLATTRNQFRLL
jgi:CRP-like cAMP-binding protein